MKNTIFFNLSIIEIYSNTFIKFTSVDGFVPVCVIQRETEGLKKKKKIFLYTNIHIQYIYKNMCMIKTQKKKNTRRKRDETRMHALALALIRPKELNYILISRIFRSRFVAQPSTKYSS